MINDRKCGGNIMQASPTSLSFTATPTGKGAWYATREYHVLNCLAEEITLRQETPERVGFLEITQTSKILNTSRLLDKNRQIEITFYNKPDNENKELAQTGFKVVGIPLTFFIFPPEASMQLYKLYKNTLSSLKFLLNQPFEEELGKRLNSISYAWGSIRLGHPKLTRNGNKEKQDAIIYIKISDAQKQVTVHNQYDIEEKLPNGTDFEYLVDQTIRIRNTSTCITIIETNNIIPEPCNENTSRWVFDTIN
ncbi:hypothetical protein GHT06_008833 [Daphnia sinensis]|uniref:Uncharacterized protein n=1 Tax=Daphnia sinensis TaxID=1820382 RepID=A0AAD5PYT6_9CRUS|nr:hypothetical protein GHT06_008833 [Daphnia sinensis]